MQRNAAHRLVGVEDRPAVLVDVVPMYSSMIEVGSQSTNIYHRIACDMCIIDHLQALGPQDDWTGIKERADRRKIQSRLNVRAHRKRTPSYLFTSPGA
jgi:hypothetical protein